MEKSASDKTRSHHFVAKWVDRCLYGAGAAIILLAVLVMIGWHTRQETLIRVLPQFAPMAHNTALVFGLCGLGLILLARRQIAMVRLCAGTAFVVALASTAQNWFSTDFGIDQVFVKSYDTAGRNPGRMAPHTAFCFLCTGVALWLSARPQTIWRTILPAILASIVTAVGATSLLGYSLGIQTAYDWTGTARMAVHTALGFIILGSALLSLAWHRERAAAPLAAILALGLTFSLMSFAVFRNLEHQRSRQDADDGVITQAVPWIAPSVSVLAAGLLLTGFLAVYIAGASRRAYKVEKLVRERTAELKLSEERYRGIVQQQSDYIAKQKETERALQESEGKARLLLESTGEGIYGVDTSGRCTFINQAGARTLGYTVEEILGKDTHTLFHHTKPDLRPYPAEESPTGRVYRTGQPCRVSDEVYWKKDGSSIPVQYCSYPIWDERGRISGAVVVFSDISHAKESEKEQRELEHQLRHAHKMEAIGQMAGGIAHDFNNVLASMLGYAKLARDGAAQGSETRDDLELVLKAGERARQLVDQLLAFSRQSPRKEGKAAVDLSASIKEAMKLLRPTIPANVEIKTVLPEGLPPVMADPAQLHQVLVNLCLNAAQAMVHGGTLTIALNDVTVTQEDGHQLTSDGRQHLEPGEYVVLAVQDTGSGIPKETLPRIFEPFFTTKKFGAGMGLAVVFGIVKAHRGEVAIYSEIGIGTAVKVYLPIARPATKSLGISDQAPTRGGEESILVVDDEELIGRMLGRTLGKLGYRVTVKTTAKEALEAFRSAPQSFDILVSDQTMPKMTGDRLAEEIGAIRRVPVIICSGFSDILTPEREKELGIFKVVRKPFMNDELEREIRNALDQAQVQRVK